MSDEAKREVDAKNVRAVRVGHGANCSSIGSVVDALFASAAIGAALIAAMAAAMSTESVRVVGEEKPKDDAPPSDETTP